MSSTWQQGGLEVREVVAHFQHQPFTYSLQVAPGECVGVVGPSGGGKSTLLAMIAGFVTPESGDIRVDGRSIVSLGPTQRPVTQVFQDHNLFAHLTLAQNVGLGLSPALRLDKDQWLRVEEALHKVGLGEMGQRLPGTLSGGQRSRAALARALLRERSVLLLDEPLAALGPAQRREMLSAIERLMDELALSVVLVSHQPEELVPLCKRIAFVAEGRIASIGSYEALVSAEAPPVVRDYLGN